MCLLPASARANDPARHWKTIESAHFLISYYEPNGDIARRAAVVAERAHRVLAPLLRHEPDEKTLVTITDDTDSANGFATVLPRNQIGLFATAPDALSTLNDHDDWLYGLIAHEYTHILHLDTIHGIATIYNHIVGKTWAPNNVQPRWFVEGLAAYEESWRSSGGRVRNAIFDMYLRVAVLAGIPLELDAVSSGPLFWPHGDAVYLYGSHFLDYIAARFGADVLTQISHEYGGQPVPYGLNRSVAHATGHDYLELYDDWMRQMRGRYQLVRSHVLARGLIEGRKLTQTGEQNLYPRYRRDGAGILWWNYDGKQAAWYRFMPRGKDFGAEEKVLRFDGAGKLSPLPDGSGAVVERGITYRTYYFWNDLYRIGWDGKSERLTFGQRASAPDVSPDGKRVAFTMNGGSRQRLAVMPLVPGAQPEILWDGERWDQAYDPAWSPDGKHIAFAAWTSGGMVDLYLFDLPTRTLRRLTTDRAIDATPRFSPDGKWLYFSSDRTGIYNIFALELATGALRQVTNVLGGAFNEDVAPDGRSLVYYDFDGAGYELHELALDPARFLPAELYVDDRPDATVIPDDESPVTPPRAYRVVETLLPLSYTLDTTVDSYGSAVTAQTSGVDIAGLASWYLALTYGRERGDVSFGAAAAWSGWWPSLSLAGGRSYGRAGGLVVNGRPAAYHAEDWSVSTSAGLPIVRLPGFSSDLSVTYALDWLRNLDAPPPPRPDQALTIPPDTGVNSGVTLRWSMSDAHGYLYTVGPIEGTSLALAFHLTHPWLGSRHRLMEFFYGANHYFHLPWNTALALSASGAVGDSDQPGNVRYFLGGTPTQDIVDSIIHSTRVGYGWLHGYPSFSLFGAQEHLVNVEYRVKIQDIEKGLVTLPFYFKRAHVAALFDAATAFDGAFHADDVRYSVGAALRLDMTFGFVVPGTFDVGVARGLSRGGDTEVWLLLTTGI